MSEFGIDTVSSSQAELEAGPIKTMRLPVDSTATVAVGQVLEYDAAANNWTNRTSGMSAAPYVVCAETKTITGDDVATCIVAGEVNKTALDATNEAEGDTLAALLASGIILRSNIA